ncbi:hypothetical protein [Candidatus Harpocratesius sp.]
MFQYSSGYIKARNRDFIAKWQNFGAICHRLIKWGKPIYPSSKGKMQILQGPLISPIGPADKAYVVFDVINRFYQEITKDENGENGFEGDLIDVLGRGYFLSFDRKDSLNIFSIREMMGLDHVILYFSELFGFLGKDKSLFNEKITDVIGSSDSLDDLEFDWHTPSSTAVRIAQLDGISRFFSDYFFKWNQFNDVYGYQRNPFSGRFAPIMYRLSEFSLEPLLMQEFTYYESIPWGDAKNPDGVRLIRSMSSLEGLVIPYFGLFKIVEARTGNWGAIIKNLQGSYEMQSLMHWSGRLKGALKKKSPGQLDFSMLINGWPICFEIIDYGEKITWGKLAGMLYGPETDVQTGNQVKEWKFPTISIGIPSDMVWYSRNAKDVGKTSPASNSPEAVRLLKAMAYINLPEVKSAVEQVYPGLYDGLMGDPLRIALFLLKSDVQVPVFNWYSRKFQTKNNNGFVLDIFAAACGFSNIEMIDRLYASYGIKSVKSNPSRMEYSFDFENKDFNLWWKQRDELHELIAKGLTWQQVKNHPNPKKRVFWRAVQLLTAADTIIRKEPTG